jgi:peptidoglycan-associated lipoprotein
MKILKLAFLALASVIVYSNSAFAQKNFLKDADKAYTNAEYFNAIELYKRAYAGVTKKEDKARIIFQTAECYRQINDSKNAEQWYEKAIKAKYPDPLALLYSANAKKMNGKYDEALVRYNDYKKEVPDDPRGENGAKSCELAAKWKDNPTPYKVEDVAQINSKQEDFSPAYVGKKYTSLYFTSTREGTTGGNPDGQTGQNFSDIFETKLDKNGKWSTPAPLPTPLNSPSNDGSCVISKKGNMIIFTRCLVEKSKEIPCALYISTKTGTSWNEPTKLPICTDSIAFAHPALSADGSILVFSSRLAGGVGGLDLWYSLYDKKTKEWGTPENLGPAINTPGDEAYPFLRDDGTLYFSSNGQLGMGGMDIFSAKNLGDNKWGEVTNLQAPINSNADDFGIIFEGKKDRGYFSSNREGGKGSDDIWQFSKPPLLFTIEGVISDCRFKETIEGVTMKLVGSDGSSAETKTDKSGYYKFGENTGKRYISESTSYVLTTAIANDVKTREAPLGFVNSSDKVKETTVGVKESKIFKHDFCLTPIEHFIRFPEVQYGLDSANLRASSKDSLNFLYETLVDNPTFVIELSAHTDARGSDKHNDILSDARAKSCVDYLISKGINPARLKAKGYGKKYPLEIRDENGKVIVTLNEKYIASLKTRQEQEAAHQRNRRTVFTVLSKDFVDPNAPKDQPKPVKKEGEDDDDQQQ